MACVVDKDGNDYGMAAILWSLKQGGRTQTGNSIVQWFLKTRQALTERQGGLQLHTQVIGCQQGGQHSVRPDSLFQTHTQTHTRARAH